MFKKQVLLGSAKSLLWRKCKLTLPLYVTYVMPSLSTNDNLLPFDFFYMNAGWYEYIYYFRFQFKFPSFLSVDRCSRSLLKKETGTNFTSPETLCLQWYENLLINPLHPDQICNSPNFQLYSSYFQFREFSIWSTNYPQINIFLYSHYLSAWYCIDTVRRNSVFVTHGS